MRNSLVLSIFIDDDDDESAINNKNYFYIIFFKIERSSDVITCGVKLSIKAKISKVTLFYALLEKMDSWLILVILK
jgi:hypothetical protein